jgi:hypothetical protein
MKYFDIMVGHEDIRSQIEMIFVVQVEVFWLVTPCSFV